MKLEDLPTRYQTQLQQAIEHDNKKANARARGNALIASAVRSQAEATFEVQCNTILDYAMQPEPEYRFDPGRRWRFDFAWPELSFAVEIEGITHDGGRHQRIAGFEKDLEKYEAAMMQGWTVYRCSPSMVKKGTAIATCERMLDVLTRELDQ